jgi:hypothetical protein
MNFLRKPFLTGSSGNICLGRRGFGGGMYIPADLAGLVSFLFALSFSSISSSKILFLMFVYLYALYSSLKLYSYLLRLNL